MKKQKTQRISAFNLREMEVGSHLHGELSQLTSIQQTIQKLQTKKLGRWSTHKEAEHFNVTKTK